MPLHLSSGKSIALGAVRGDVRQPAGAQSHFVDSRSRSDTSMHRTLLAVMLSGAIGLTLSGCALNESTLRGQSPGSSCNSYSSCQSCDYGGYGMGCPTGTCPSGSCQGQACNLPFHPVHRNFYTVDAPTGQLYPDANAAPALTMYPYYTLRGPTDFLMP